MFKILLIKINILYIKLGQGGGVAEWDGPVDRSEGARTPHSCGGHVLVVVSVVVVVLGGVVGDGSDITATCRCRG